MKRSLKVFVLISIIFTVFLQPFIPISVFAAEEEFVEFTSKSTTDVNKEWKIEFSAEINEDSINESNIYILDAAGEEVAINKPVVEGKFVKVSPVEAYTVGETYTMYLLSTIESLSGKTLYPSTKFTFDIEGEVSEDTVIDQPGTYGNTTYNGNVTIESSNVTLENATIKGNLVISEDVGEGEVFFNQVIVEGETKILGGGENSIYFTDSALATVIVNKNNGAIRVVVKGDTFVKEVLLESVATLEEVELSNEGFSNVDIQESAQNSDGTVMLLGSFDTINVRATDVQIDLPQATSIEQLVLSAVAAVTGEGSINSLNVLSTASGSTLDMTPHSAVIDISSYITIGESEVTESYTNVDQAVIEGIEATQSYISLKLDQSIFNLTLEDFDVIAMKNGAVIPLEDLSYNANLQMFFFKPFAVSENIYETVEIKVQPSEENLSLSGSTEDSFVLDYGFSGRITDIYGNGVENITVEVDNVYNRGVTNEKGYYQLITGYADVFTGQISGPGYLDGNIHATVPENTFQTGINETIMRAASSQEWKIMLTWNDQEPDVDSHLSSENFHVYYGNRNYYGPDGLEYVDLDWDDTHYYGPETTTIRKFEDGRYVFFLHNYSGYKPLSESGSKVQVFKGNSTVADYTFEVPNDTGDARYWGVFELLVSDNGETIELIELNMPADDESIIMDPYSALQQLVNEANLLDNSEIPEEDQSAFEQALANAQSLLNTNGTTKELIEVYNNLKLLIPSYTYYSSYGNYFEFHLQTNDYDMINMGEPVNFDMRFVNDPYYHIFEDTDKLQFTGVLHQYGYNEQTDEYETYPLINQKFQMKNPITGEETILLTDNQGKIDFGIFDFNQLDGMPVFSGHTILNGTGDIYFEIDIKVVNRINEFGDAPLDAMYVYFYVN